MNVQELKEVLDKLPGSMEILMSRDAEGNSILRMDDAVSIGYAQPLFTKYGDIYEYELMQPEDFSEGWIATIDKCLILWPT